MLLFVKLHYIAFYHISLHYIELHDMKININNCIYIKIQNTSLKIHYITVQYIAFHSITLHCIDMHLMDLLAHLFVSLFVHGSIQCIIPPHQLTTFLESLSIYQAVSEIFYGSRGAMPKCQSSGSGFDEAGRSTSFEPQKKLPWLVDLGKGLYYPLPKRD